MVLDTQGKTKSCTACKFCKLVETNEGIKIRCTRASARKTLRDFNLNTFKKLNSKACLYYEE